MKDKRGISTVEWIIVLGIIAILLSVGVPKLGRFRSDLELKAAVRNVISLLTYAKTASFRYEPGISIEFSVSQRRIITCLDVGRDASCAGDIVFQQINLPNSVIIEDPNFGGTAGVFFEKGLPRGVTGGFASGTVILRDQKTNSCYKLFMNSGGRVRMGQKNEDC